MPPPETSLYRLAGVSKIYRKSGRDIPAVRDLDLEIRAGEWLAVQGKTGHGKSTLLQLLGGLDRPTAGRLEFAGHDLATGAETKIRKVRATSFGFIFQSFNLVPTLTAAENVEAALIPLGVPHERREKTRPRWTASGSATGRSTCPASCPAASSSVSRSPAPWSRAGRAAGGRADRNLDEDTRDEIIGLLDTLWRERGLTLILVTHDSAIARRAQRTG